MFKEISHRVLKAIENSPSGIAGLDILKSIGLCEPATLKTTLSRLNKAGKIIRLKRGVYSTNPMEDAFACAQATFNGYLGFSSALYLHKLITEMPFTITVVTMDVSRSKSLGGYEFRAVSLKEKALGFEKRGVYVVSTLAKTLFDCLYLPRYSVEKQKLFAAFREAGLPAEARREFDLYAEKFARGTRIVQRIEEARKILGGRQLRWR